MQKNLRTAAALDSIKLASSVVPVNKSAPVELDASLFNAVSGGLSPRGTWAAESTVAPKSTK